jgi:ubiquinone/menaquinone biosynthesis C-methylase UbiE
MGLAVLAEVAPMLVCPRCRCRVVEAAEGFRCVSDSCPLNVPSSFPVIERWPVLVDFEHSILESADLAGSVIGPDPDSRRWSITRLPRRLRSWWKPRNRVAASNVQTLLGELPEQAPVILVVGGGVVGNGVEAIYADPRVRVLAFDIYASPLVQFIADAHQIPLAAESVDAVVVQAVLEHVLDPGKVVAEIQRVLRPSGLVYAETPFLQQVHAGPYDFTRYTSSGHRYLFRAFDEVAAGPVAGPGTQMLTSVDHLVRALLRSPLAGRLARLAFFWLRYLDRLVPMSFAMDNASAYYFLGRRAERELEPSEIVSYYRGHDGGGSHPAATAD